jgi:hypothetical protein
MSFEENSQRIVAAHAKSLHQVFIREGSKAGGREKSGCQFFIRKRHENTQVPADTVLSSQSSITKSQVPLFSGRDV